MSSRPLDIKIKILDKRAVVPTYERPHDAGLDLRALDDCIIKPFERVLVGTGIAIALPEGFGAFVQPRSGLSHRTGLTMINTPGLIDPNYRGEIKISAVNLDPHTPVEVHAGDRIAQLVLVPVYHASFQLCNDLGDTLRGDEGFGSSGLH